MQAKEGGVERTKLEVKDLNEEFWKAVVDQRCSDEENSKV